MNPSPLVSIIIDNYNYGRYVGEATRSALCQTYTPVEVIVVDDGSNDDSRAVIAAFGDQVTPVFKANGGQASAFNAGFAACHGEIVFFLDADDRLEPEIVQRMVAEFVALPTLSKVQFRLAMTDAAGYLTGQVQPPWHKPMPNGDVLPALRRFPDDICWQPTSGNAFAARVLRQILPMPEASFRLCADYYLANLPPLFGPVASLEAVGGHYRLHGANRHYTAQLNLAQTRRIIQQTCALHHCLKDTADRLGLAGFPTETTATLAVTFLAHRLISQRLDPAQHPIPGDNALQLGWRGIRAALGPFDLAWPARGARVAWFAVTALAPRRLVGWLAQRFAGA